VVEYGGASQEPYLGSLRMNCRLTLMTAREVVEMAKFCNNHRISSDQSCQRHDCHSLPSISDYTMSSLRKMRRPSIKVQLPRHMEVRVGLVNVKTCSHSAGDIRFS
jgi:hypothetical protein